MSAELEDILGETMADFAPPECWKCGGEVEDHEGHTPCFDCNKWICQRCYDNAGECPACMIHF